MLVIVLSTHTCLSQFHVHITHHRTSTLPLPYRFSHSPIIIHNNQSSHTTRLMIALTRFDTPHDDPFMMLHDPLLTSLLRQGHPRPHPHPSRIIVVKNPMTMDLPSPGSGACTTSPGPGACVTNQSEASSSCTASESTAKRPGKKISTSIILFKLMYSGGSWG